MNIFGDPWSFPMVCILFTFLMLSLNHVKTIVIKYLLLDIMFKGPPCLYSKVGLYFDSCQM